MVKSRLGPGTWMNRIDATTKASSWLVLGMSSIVRCRRPDANPIPQGGQWLGLGPSDGIAIVATVIFKRVSDGRPYPEHGLRTRDWAQVAPRQVRLDELVTTKDTLQLAALLDEDSTFYGDLFAHVVEWRGDLYLEDGLHRALRAALQQRNVLHARVLVVEG